MDYRKLPLVVGLAGLAGCQTNYSYVPIVPQPVQLEMADAQCRMMSSSAEQGMVAWGTPGYVAGAQLGNAISNSVRVDQFMQQCMTLQGWRRVAKQPEASTNRTAQASPNTAAEREVTSGLAMGIIADTCSIKLKNEKQEWLREARKSASPAMTAQAKRDAANAMNANTTTGTKAQMCTKARGILKDDMKWI